MKYALRVHEGQAKKEEIDKKRIINIGDLFMCLSIKKIYDSMMIPDENIVPLQTYDFETWEGEYLVLPMNFYESSLRLSPRILPVFLALSLEWEQEWSSSDMELLRRFAPIGCRDELTMRELYKRGIDAYLNGCMVSIFPKRNSNPANWTKVFLVDPHISIMSKIPSELLDNSVKFSHEYYMSLEEFLGDKKDIFEYAQSVIDMYAQEAKMIITSRFHGAVIALALGIPVILIMDNFYAKYTWIKKFIPVYTPNDIDSIDWKPKPVVIPDEEKKLMISIAQNSIRNTYNKYVDICTLSEKRENIKIKNFDYLFYGEDAIKFVSEHWDEDTEIQYSFWGCTHTAVKLFQYISEHCPKAKLTQVYDMVVRNKFCGINPVASSEIEKDNPEFIFVTADSAVNAAKDLFSKMNKSKEEIFYCERKNDV